MSKQKTLLLLCGLLLLGLLAIVFWYLKKNQTDEPTGNARFVQAPQARRKEETMEETARTALAPADANGNAGVYPPEREIRYKGCAQRESRGTAHAKQEEA